MRNPFSIERKKIIISGANGFLGRYLFEYIVKNNGIPILIDIDDKNILKSRYKKFIINKKLIFKADITKKVEVKNIFKIIKKRFKKIHSLVNLAALAMPQMKNKSNYFNSFENYNFELWKHANDVNLNGIFLVTQEVVRLMKKNNYGSIINMSSDISIISPDHDIYKPDLKMNYKGVKFNTPISYVVSKTGILGFSRYLATYLAKKNIRVNSISPSGVYNKQPKKFVQKLSTKIPLGRMAKPEEVINAIIYLISDASSFTTGSNLVVDGGRTII
jgi:NAD(P)-dependent dehydrogenase (short-subunit alcohol dehydrogenase family)